MIYLNRKKRKEWEREKKKTTKSARVLWTESDERKIKRQNVEIYALKCLKQSIKIVKNWLNKSGGKKESITN